MARRTRLLSDTAANDSNKSLSYEAGGYWKVSSVRVEYAATATAGNRILEVRFLDSSGDVVYTCYYATAITANQTVVMNFSPGATTVAATSGGAEGSQHIAEYLPPGGGSIQVIDSAAVAAAADDVVVHAVLVEA